MKFSGGTVLVIVLLIVVVGGGIYLLTSNSGTPTTPTPTPTPGGGDQTSNLVGQIIGGVGQLGAGIAGAVAQANAPRK